MKKQFIIVASVLLLVVFGQVISATEYTITDLGTLGGSISIAHDINNNGQVVGESFIAGNSVTHAYLYDGTTMKDLGTLGGNDSVAYGINDHGQIIGSSSMLGSHNIVHAFLYDGAIMHDLGSLGGDFSDAYSINNYGQVAGYSDMAGGSYSHAFLYDGTTIHDLGTLSMHSTPLCVPKCATVMYLPSAINSLHEM